MDGVVDAVVTGNPTSQHLRIGGVHDRIHAKRRDVAAPERDVRIQWHAWERGGIGDARLLYHAAEHAILHFQELAARRLRFSRVHERTEAVKQLALVIAVRVAGAHAALALQLGYQPPQVICSRHRAPLLYCACRAFL